MELAPVNTDVIAFPDFDLGDIMESFRGLVDSQREIFNIQVENFQSIVILQCQLTGVNPLPQEMAAGALAIKSGKRPRDLLNTKAIKYMQSVFSIKDTIGKKETREISVQCGATITQVREFFAGQRSRVRKFVRLSREKAIMLDSCKHISNECLSDQSSAIVVDEAVPLNSVADNVVHEYLPQRDMVKGSCRPQVTTDNVNAVLEEKQIPVHVDIVNLKTSEESVSCSSHEEKVPDIDMDSKRFTESIFNLMRKEETFAGQVKLMEWILQINDPAMLFCFLARGGVSILATWLSQAAVEEQSTVIFFIFKVLCHLPLHKALPVEMSAMVQSVNKLKFYRASDISNKARFLLSRWSKLLVRSQNVKRFCTDSQKERFRKQRIMEILSDESWQSKIDIPNDILALEADGSESREFDCKPLLKLLPASGEYSNKKNKQTVSALKTKERRKVLLVEHPDHTAVPRSVCTARVVPANNSRPLSADDIQKAKMRALYMQDKYGKIVPAASEKCLAGIDNDRNEMLTHKLSNFIGQEDKHSNNCLREILQVSNDFKPTCDPEDLTEKLKIDQILWRIPPVHSYVVLYGPVYLGGISKTASPRCKMKVDKECSVGTGENSKEVDAQTQRNKREMETIYSNVSDIPSNPKEPWDMEMDFDDSLTPEIPSEQPPDTDSVESQENCSSSELPQSSCPAEDIDKPQDLPAAIPVSSVTNGLLEPDLELLAVLLKNPDLVFALTSGQGVNMNDAQTVALLDMLKNMGTGNAGTPNVVSSSPVEQQEPLTSLPSPTPPAERTWTGWRNEPEIPSPSELLQHHLPLNGVTTTVSTVTPNQPTMLGMNVHRPPTRPSHVVPHATKPIMSLPQPTAELNLPEGRTSDISFLNTKLLHMNQNLPAGISHKLQNFETDPMILHKLQKFAPQTSSSRSTSTVLHFPQLHLNSMLQPSITEFQRQSPPPIRSVLPTTVAMRAEPQIDTWSSTRQNGLLQTSGGGVYRGHTAQNRRDIFPERPTSTPYILPESSVSRKDEFDVDDGFSRSGPYRNSDDYRLESRFSRSDRVDQPWQNGSSHHRNHPNSGRRWGTRDDDWRR